MPKDKTYAAIDIGSNAVRLLIKRLSLNTATGQQTLEKQLLLRYPLRLGFDVFEHGKISKTKADNLQRLMKAYRNLMDIYSVNAYRACATSAMRDSKNGPRLIRKIRKTSGIRIDIIDGQEEARMVYDNHLECLEDRSGNYMYVDVGGGSTEVNLLIDGDLRYAKSFNIGTIRILTGGVTEAAWTAMQEEITAATADFKDINIIGSGGNINKLYKLVTERDKVRKRISVNALQAIYDKLAPLSPAERAAAYGLRPDRADVIEPAARIFLAIATAIHAEYISVPVIGISDGIIDNLLSKDMDKARRKAEKAARRKALNDDFRDTGGNPPAVIPDAEDTPQGEKEEGSEAPSELD